MAWHAPEAVPTEKASRIDRQFSFMHGVLRFVKPTAAVALAIAAALPVQAEGMLQFEKPQFVAVEAPLAAPERDKTYYAGLAQTLKAVEEHELRLPVGIAVGMLRMMRGGMPVIEKTVNTGSDYNLFTDCGSPSFPCVVICTVSGTIGASTTGNYGFDTGTGWASGTSLLLVNNGIICGEGGVGGGGGNGTGSAANGRNGTVGGGAVNCNYTLTIDNTNGYIYAGSGGAGGGADYLSGSAGAGGGGGGGGRSFNSSNSTGGPASAFAPGGGQAGGGAGFFSAGGAGGIHGHDSFYNVDGGNGGDNSAQGWGASGANGQNTSMFNGGTGGASGPSVRSNSNTITWTGGNNGTQVKGPQI